MTNNKIIGLDWEGVIPDYYRAFSVLVEPYSLCVIITLKSSLTTDEAAKMLSINESNLIIEICPEERQQDYQVWKAEMCIKHNVGVMFDDDPTVVYECKQQKI